MGVDLDRWKGEALALEGEELETKVPLRVLTGEAVDVANFFAKYWKTQMDGDTVVRLGLETAVKKGQKGQKLTKKTGEDILSMQRATQEASSLYLLSVGTNAEEHPADRGRYVLGEITAALEWHFDDGVEDENDKKLAALEDEHGEHLNSLDGLASALDDYAHLAEPFRDELDGVGGFDAALIEEAKSVAEKLRHRPQTPSPTTPDAGKAKVLRNKMANLLYARMSLVRAAARFVFRDHPEIVREATSAYERRKRAAARRAAEKKKKDEAKTP